MRPSGNPEWKTNDLITEDKLNNIEEALKAVETVSSLPSPGTPGRIVRLSSDGHLYLDSGSAWLQIILKADLDAHVGDTNNPHGVTKAQVGLGNVQNYGIATQAEAEAGTVSNKYMTPLRTRQAIEALSPDLPPTTSPGGTEPNRIAVTDASGRVGAADTLDGKHLTSLLTINGFDTRKQIVEIFGGNTSAPINGRSGSQGSYSNAYRNMRLSASGYTTGSWAMFDIQPPGIDWGHNVIVLDGIVRLDTPTSSLASRLGFILTAARLPANHPSNWNVYPRISVRVGAVGPSDPPLGFSLAYENHSSHFWAPNFAIISSFDWDKDYHFRVIFDFLNLKVYGWFDEGGHNVYRTINISDFTKPSATSPMYLTMCTETMYWNTGTYNTYIRQLVMQATRHVALFDVPDSSGL